MSSSSGSSSISIGCESLTDSGSVAAELGDCGKLLLPLPRLGVGFATLHITNKKIVSTLL
jgi:hypothetical protein